MRWLASVVAVGSLAVPAAGEAAPSAPFKVAHRTSRVTYYAPKGRAVDVRRTEAFLDRLTTLFGATPEGWRLEYYLHGSERDLKSQSGLSAIGVTDLDALRIDSVREYHPHELVHAAAGRLGRPPLLFAEGLAVALTSEGQWRGSDLDARARAALAANPSLEPFLAQFTEQDADTAYAVGGSLVAYLLDRHGVEPMVAFFQGCGLGNERYGYERAFQRAYGRSVARATLEWQRALRAETRTARAWYDPASWPGSLQRDAAAVAGTQNVARGVARAEQAGDAARALEPALSGGPPPASH